MDIDGLIGLFGALLYWRVLLCLLGSSAFAIALVHIFPWFSGIQGLAIAGLGLGFGAAWEHWESRSTGINAAPERETKPFTATLATTLASGTWGLLSSSSSHTFVTGLLILAVALWWWIRYFGKSKSASDKGGFLLLAGLAVAVYMIAAAFFNIAF